MDTHNLKYIISFLLLILFIGACSESVDTSGCPYPDSCNYNFFVQVPGKNISVVIKDEDEDGLLLIAGFSGKRGQLNDRALLRTMVTYPLMTLKVILGIHIEAIKLLIKRAPYFPHKKYPKQGVHVKGTLKPLRQYRK